MLADKIFDLLQKGYGVSITPALPHLSRMGYSETIKITLTKTINGIPYISYRIFDTWYLATSSLTFEEVVTRVLGFVEAELMHRIEKEKENAKI